MPRANPLQPALNAGEFSPRMEARVDFAKYANAAATVKNMIPLAQGGLSRRPGTRFVAKTKDPDAKARLLRFEFSTEQAYAIEAGNAYFRFYRNLGRISVAATDGGIGNGDFTSDIGGWDNRSTGSGSIAHDATNGRLNLVPGGTGGTDIGWAEQDVTITAGDETKEHVLIFRVLGAPGDTVELRIGTTSTGSEVIEDETFEVGTHTKGFIPAATTFYIQFRNRGNLHNKTLQIDDVGLLTDQPLEIATPYQTAELFDLKTTQSADILYISHPGRPIHRLQRTGHTSWSFIEVPYRDGPYLDENTTATTFTPAATGGLNITLTASATDGINDNKGFLSSDVGRLVRIQHGSNQPGWGIIIGVTSATQATIDIRRAFNATSATSKWRLGAWSQTTGFPATVGFFEQRFGAARTTKQPQKFWLSQSADIENMRPDSFVESEVAVEDDDALDFQIAADQANAIQWLASTKQLALGTSGGLWIGESDGAVLTPNDIQVRRQTTNGAADVQPVLVDDAVLVLQRGRRKILEFTFNFDTNGFRAPDMTVLADHITESGVVELAYQEEPDSTVWCVREDGVLAGMTFRREQDVVGWGRHVFGGSYLGGNAVCESVTTIPGNGDAGTQERNEVWVCVKRTIDGSTVRTVEFLEGEFTGPLRNDYATVAAWEAAMLNAQQNAFYVDCGLSLNDPKSIAGASQADPVVITATGHGFANGDRIRIHDVVGMTHLNGNVYKAANGTAGTFELTDLEDNGIDGTAFGAYVAGGVARAEVSVISGLGHLEGETVKILTDGAVHPDRTVAGGSITLERPASRVHVGLGYAHRYRSLKMIAGAAAGTAVGKTKRIHGVTLLLLDAAATQIGPDDETLDDIEFRDVADPMDTAVPLFTGEHFIEFPGDYERDARIVIQGDAPAPFTVLALAPELKTNEQV
jgi:hypothetical protein